LTLNQARSMGSKKREDLDFDAAGYLKRLKDLDHPLSLSSPWLFPPRPDQDPPVEQEGRKSGVKLPTPLTVEEKAKLRSEYLANVKLPATTTFDSFPAHCLTCVLPGKAWVVPSLLTEEECEEIIEAGEQWGLTRDNKRDESAPVKDSATRTSKRTNNWISEELSIKMIKKLPEELLKVVEASVPYTSVRAVHPNWRVACYQRDETFPAHTDQADSVVVEHPEKKKQRFTSSHTLLIYLRRRGEQFTGGATRIWVDGSYSGRTVDVCLPQGWALVFQQKGVLHAGLPVEGEGAKYIAQAGILRAEPTYTAGACAIFKYGPGLAPY